MGGVLDEGGTLGGMAIRLAAIIVNESSHADLEGKGVGGVVVRCSDTFLVVYVEVSAAVDIPCESGAAASLTRAVWEYPVVDMPIWVLIL